MLTHQAFRLALDMADMTNIVLRNGLSLPVDGSPEQVAAQLANASPPFAELRKAGAVLYLSPSEVAYFDEATQPEADPTARVRSAPPQAPQQY